MRYGRVLGDAWKRLWHAWAIWGIVATSFGLMAVVMGGLFFGFWSVFADTVVTNGEPDLVPLLALMVIGALAGLIMIPVTWLFRAASIHLANEALEGRPVRYVDGLKAGARRLGSLALFEIAIFGIIVVVLGVFMVVWTFLVATIFSTGDQASGALGAVFTGFCFIYLLLILVYVAVILLFQPFEAVGSRAAVLSGRTGFQSFGDAWAALRHSFKAMLVMSLIVLGIMWAYSIISSVVLTPIQLLMMPGIFFDPTVLDTADPAALFSSMSTFYGVYAFASILLMFPLTVFTDLVWTSFYRHLVGIVPAEEPVAPPVYPYPAPATDVPAAPASGIDYGAGPIPPPPGAPVVTAPPPAPARPEETPQPDEGS